MVHYELIGGQLVCRFRRRLSTRPREQSLINVGGRSRPVNLSQKSSYCCGKTYRIQWRLDFVCGPRAVYISLNRDYITNFLLPRWSSRNTPWHLGVRRIAPRKEGFLPRYCPLCRIHLIVSSSGTSVTIILSFFAASFTVLQCRVPRREKTTTPNANLDNLTSVPSNIFGHFSLFAEEIGLLDHIFFKNLITVRHLL